MIKLGIPEVIQACRGVVAREHPQCSITGVSTDSRTIAAGELFFALRGPNFDGHAFVGAALQRGASAAVVAADRAASLSDGGAAAAGAGALLICVDDPLAALGRLAAFHRRQCGARVIAVVGSNGKTTTQTMIEHVLRAALRGRSSRKSFNNAIGVPLTLLAAEPSDEFLVVEIGTNAPGEVAALAELAAPELAVITCIGEEHLDGLGDLAGVAREECAVLGHVQPGGFAAVNVDWPGVRELLPRDGGALTIATFGGADSGADLRVSDVRLSDARVHFKINDRLALRLRTINPCNAWNAAAAVAVARRLGLSDKLIAERLDSFEFPPMRSQLLTSAGVTIVNDAYNANPHSMRAALATLAALPARRRVLVAGEMRELGAAGARLHAEIAEHIARDERIDHVVLVGAAAALMESALRASGRASVQCAAAPLDAAEHLAEWLAPGDAVLFKASRAVGLESAVAALLGRLAPRDEDRAAGLPDSLLGQPAGKG